MKILFSVEILNEKKPGGLGKPPGLIDTREFTF